MTAADAPELLRPEQIVPGCDHDALWITAFAAYDDSGRLWRDVATDLAAKLAAAEQNSREMQMLAFKWMERHDRVCAGKPGGPFPSPVDLPDSIARADRAEAALVAVQDALRAQWECNHWEHCGVKDHTGLEPDCQWPLPKPLRALPIPAAKPEGE